MKDFLMFMLARLKERSTWLGLISFITAMGLLLTPEQQEAIMATGIAVAGAVTAFTRDI
jgi:NhaP-type Na+/H+ and K+/H+ antiporter